MRRRYWCRHAKRHVFCAMMASEEQSCSFRRAFSGAPPHRRRRWRATSKMNGRISPRRTAATAASPATITIAIPRTSNGCPGWALNAYRFGIEWSRLQSAPFAPLNPQELARYVDMLDRLNAAGITPMVVLHHFSNPPWINAAGGWTNAAAIPAFVDYVSKLVAALKDRVYLWNTFNEPDTYACVAYLLGGFPPQRKWKLGQFRRVIDHMARAHVAGQPHHPARRAARAANRKSASPRTGLFFTPTSVIRPGTAPRPWHATTRSINSCWTRFSAAGGGGPPLSSG